MRSESLKVVDMMERYGGGFVNALAACIRRADEVNLQKLHSAFPEYWKQYLAMWDNVHESDGVAE